MNLVIRKACVRWKGDARGDTRVVTTEGGVLKKAKFTLGVAPKPGSEIDPSELIAAAHASSFSLALSNKLGLKACAVGKITTTATVTLKRVVTGWTIMNIHLNVLADLPHTSQGKFIDAAVCAKTTCLISRLLRANISMHAKLEK